MRSLPCDYMRSERKTMEVVWSCPTQGWSKVNADGSYVQITGSTACGGLLRDDQGRFVHGFYCKLVSASVIWAKLWALRLGIKLAQHLNLKWVMFELDFEGCYKDGPFW